MAKINSSTRKHKHPTLDDRFEIQDCLSKGMSFKAIALRIDKDPITVSKKVVLHCKSHSNGFVQSDQVCPKLLKALFVCNGCKNRSNAGCRLSRRIYIAKDAEREYETTLFDSREGVPLTHEEFYESERIISTAVMGGQHVYHAILVNHLLDSSSTSYHHINKSYYSISRIDLPRAVKFKPRKQSATVYVPEDTKVGLFRTSSLFARIIRPFLSLR